MVTNSQPKAKPNIQQILPTFQEMLPAQFIRDLAKAAYSPKGFYERLFTPLIVVWCLVFQRLNEDHSCDAVVSHVGSKAVDHLDDRHQEPPSQRMRSESTSGFCQARQALPLEVLEEALASQRLEPANLLAVPRVGVITELRAFVDEPFSPDVDVDAERVRVPFEVLP